MSRPEVPARYEALMVKVVDETATPAEREELATWLADKPELRRELEEHRALRAVTDGWVARLEAELARERAAEGGGAAGFAERTGVALLVLGVLVLGGWGVLSAWRDPEVPVPVDVGLTALVLGLLLVLGTLAARRLRAPDPYEKLRR